jgi:uncharacterized membrane protein YcaP (DUF421 family)
MLNFNVAPWELAVRSAVIYLALLLALRLFGKREVGQFTIYDLVLILLVANAVQPAMTGPDTSLAGGVIIILVLVVINFAISRLDRIGPLHRVLQPQPTLIVRDGHYLDDRLRREGVDRDECETAIREHGLADVGQVAMGVLEPDGTISIIGRDAPVSRTRRRVRFRRHP